MTDTNRLAEISELHRRARARTDAAAFIDGAHVQWLARMSNCDAAVGSYAMSPAAAAAERARLTDAHAVTLRTIADAPEARLYTILNPTAPTVEQNRAAQAQAVVEQARAAGVILESPAAGVVDAAPSAKLTQPLRDRIKDLRPEISAFLRASIETFAASA